MVTYRITSQGQLKEIVKGQIAEAQRNHWLKIHRYTLEPWCPIQAAKDHAEWRKNIPRYGCSCQSDWATLEKKHPADFSSSDAYFYWGVDRHNDINRKLKKPEVSHGQAWEMHRNCKVVATTFSSSTAPPQPRRAPYR